MDNLLRYDVPQDSISQLEQTYKGETLLHVEILERVATALLTDGPNLFPKTPLLLPGADTYITPKQFEELKTKVKLLDVDDDETGRTDGVPSAQDMMVESRRGTVQPAMPPVSTIPPQVEASLLDLPTQDEQMKAAKVIEEKEGVKATPPEEGTVAVVQEEKVATVKPTDSENKAAASTSKKSTPASSAKGDAPEENKEQTAAGSTKGTGTGPQETK